MGALLDVSIALGLLASASRMAWLGVHVSLYPPKLEVEKRKRKKQFLWLGGIAAALTIAQGVRNGITQQELLRTISQNRPQVNVTVPPSTVIQQSAPSPSTPAQVGPTWKWQRSKDDPGIAHTQPGLTALISAVAPSSDLTFTVKCSVPCSFDKAQSTSIATASLFVPLPSSDPTISRVRVMIPNRLEAGGQLYLRFASNDSTPLAIQWVSDGKYRQP
jgi:hypothetical protein